MFLLITGVTSVVFATALENNIVLAQSSVGIDCSELTGVDKLACEATNKEARDNAAEENAPAEEPDCEPDANNPNACCGGVRTSIIGGNLCGDNSDTENGTIYKLLIGALNILTAGIGIAAVGGIAYGALLYTTAESKPEQTKKAISIITNVVIGIAAYALMFVLLNFLIPGGIFTLGAWL